MSSVIIEKKTQCDAKVVADSFNGIRRLTTLQLRYPRIIHAELMTHRVFSRNASSSRAIPTHKMLAMVANEPARPVRFGQNQPGMQDKGEDYDTIITVPDVLSGPYISYAEEMFGQKLDWDEAPYYLTAEAAWEFSAWLSTHMSKAFTDAGYHKQVANRLTEPFQYINVIVTATDWDNFFALRYHDAADPTIYELASVMRQAIADSTPRAFVDGWHLPYISKEEKAKHSVGTLLRCSVARCARVSYLTHEGKEPSIDDDMKLFDRLVGADPKHMSPTEHQAFARPKMGMGSNLFGWTQYRKYIEQDVSID